MASNPLELLGAQKEGAVEVHDNSEDQPLEDKFRYGSTEHTTLLGYVIKLRNSGIKVFSGRKSDWDDVDNYTQMKLDLTAGARLGDKTRSTEIYETPHARSLVIPVTFAALYTRHAQKLLLLLSRDPEVEGVSPDDVKRAQFMTAMLGYSVRKTGWTMLMNQISWDDERYGISILYDTYEKEHGFVIKPPLARPGELTMLAGDPRVEEGAMRQFPEIFRPSVEWQETCRYNKVTCIDPRRFFMDPSGSIQYLQSSRYVGHEFTRSYEYLLEHAQENGGVYFNLDEVKDLTGSKLSSTTSRQRRSEFFGPGDLDGNHIVSHIQMKVIPSDTELNLSNETKPEIWWVTWVDDAVIIRVHKNPYLHYKYTYAVGEAIPDAHTFDSPGWGEQALGIQTTVNYLINSHLANVRKTLNNSMIYSPDLVYEEDLLNPTAAGHVRLTREGTRLLRMGNINADQLVKQLGVIDVTRGHLDDAAMLSDWAQRSLGANDPMQGMPTPGKRTLGEINTIMASASQRVGTSARLIDAQVVQPVIERAIVNIQQLTEDEQWVRIMGSQARELEQQAANDPRIMASPGGGIRVLISPDDLYGAYDYVPMTFGSGMSAREQPETWMKIYELMTNSPGGQMPDEQGRIPDIQKVFGELIRSMGIKNIEDYYRQAPPPPPPPGGPIPTGVPGAPQVSVVPDEQFAQQTQQGNYVPVQ